MYLTPEMPLYVCHKEVRALKIESVQFCGPHGTIEHNESMDEATTVIMHFNENKFSRQVSILNRPRPEVGWYFIDYGDGYHSFSPAAKFEDGYTLKKTGLSYSCSAHPQTAMAGDIITLMGIAENLDLTSDKVYTWATTGGKISGTSNVATLDTWGLAPGEYTVKGHVSQGPKPGQMADCSTTFTIFAAPTSSELG